MTSRFDGQFYVDTVLVIASVDDHLPAHFHARHAGREMVVAIDTFAVLRGQLSPRAHVLVVEWASLHADELRADWELARSSEPLVPIPPLR